MHEKPVAAIISSLIGASLILFNGFFYTIIFINSIDYFFFSWFPIYAGIMIIVGIIMIIVGSTMINSVDKNRVNRGSIIILFFSIMVLFIGGGFLIGSILCIVSGVLGLIWKPPLLPPPPPTPPLHVITPIYTPTPVVLKREKDLIKLEEEKEVEEMTRWLETAIRKVEKLIEEIEKS
ncbi:MAG: hypothetical protein QXR44_04110 [Thermoproteota archaeon]